MSKATPQSGRKGSRPNPRLERPLSQRRLSTPGSSRAPSVLFAGYGSRLSDGLAATIAGAMLDVPVDFGGGCPILKGFLLADLIVDRRMNLAVEIGVYRGRSIVPQALAFKSLGAGRVIGIDPYRAAVARQTDDHEAPLAILDDFVERTDWDGLYLETQGRLSRLGVGDFGELRRMTSHEAADSFADRSVDMLHIDGNHDLAAVLDDLTCCLPKLRHRAYLVMDDASWRAIRPALMLWMSPCSASSVSTTVDWEVSGRRATS
jgi:hypothetical protein